MMKHLLAATAVVATTLAAGAAGAQDATTAQPQTAAPMAPATNDMFFMMPTPATGEVLASTLMGDPVYNSDAEGAQEIGQVKDFVVAQDGSIEAVIIGVGGFLGIGQKDVAVNFANIAWAAPLSDGQEPRLVVATTSDQLNAAPAFDTAAFATMPPTGTIDSTAMAPAEQPAATGSATGSDVATLPSDLTDVDPASISANDLIGTTVYSAENENVGEVADVVLNQDGSIDAVVLDIGGFLGIGQKPVAIAFEGLGVRRDQNGGLYVYTAFTRSQLETAPDYFPDRYPAERDTMRLTTG